VFRLLWNVLRFVWGTIIVIGTIANLKPERFRAYEVKYCAGMVLTQGVLNDHQGTH